MDKVTNSERSQYFHFNLKIVLENLALTVFHIYYENGGPGWACPYRRNDFYELHYINKGKGSVTDGEIVFSLRPGTFYLVPPDSYYRFQSDKWEPMSGYQILFDINQLKATPKDAADILLKEEVDLLVKSFCTPGLKIGNDGGVSDKTFQDLKMELDREQLHFYLFIHCLFLTIFTNASKCFLSERNFTYTPAAHDPYLNDSLKFIITHTMVHNFPNLNDVAKEINISPRHLERLCHKYYGMSFNRKLNEAKINEAKRLLLFTDLKLQEIAAMVNFSSYKQFFLLFKRMEKMPPLKYRKLYKKTIMALE